MANVYQDGATLLIQVVNVVDSTGSTATFKNAPVWTSSDVTILNPVAASGGLSASGVALKSGQVTITVVGDGVTESVLITVTAGTVVSFQLQVSVLTPPPPPPPPGS